MSIPLAVANFFQNYFVAYKNWRGGGRLLLKMYNRWLRLQIMLLPGPDLHCVGPIGVARIFDWGGPKPQITCNDVIRNFRKSNFLWGKDIVEWKI